MEINEFTQVVGAVATEDIVDGRMGLFSAHTWSKDFGSLTDLPGVKLPDSATEAGRSKYLITWAKDNRSTPIYSTYPARDWAMRRGFDQAANSPFTATVYNIHPEYLSTPQTIPSGSQVILYGPGTYATVTSGHYVYNASLTVPGATLSVQHADTADKGKLIYSTTNIVGEVYSYDATSGDLTFRIDG